MLCRKLHCVVPRLTLLVYCCVATANHDMRIYLYYVFVGVPLVSAAYLAQWLIGLVASPAAPHAFEQTSDTATLTEDPLVPSDTTSTGDDPTKQALAEVRGCCRCC